MLLRDKVVWWCFIACKRPKNCKKHSKNCWCWHFLPIFRPLTGNKTEEVLSFDLVGDMWKLVKNWLQEWVRVRVRVRLTFTSKNEEDLDELHILKIIFKNGLEIGMENFPHHFPQEFPARISHKIFPQEFPARFSRKIFPELDPDWWAPHHPIPNAKFPPITALLNRPTYHKRSKVSPPPFPEINE